MGTLKTIFFCWGAWHTPGGKTGTESILGCVLAIVNLPTLKTICQAQHDLGSMCISCRKNCKGKWYKSWSARSMKTPFRLSTWKMIDFLLYYELSEMRMKSPIQFNGMQTQIPGCSNFWFKIVNYWVIKWPSRPTTTPCNKLDRQCSCTLCGFEACNYIQQNVIIYSNNFHKCYDKKSF